MNNETLAQWSARTAELNRQLDIDRAKDIAISTAAFHSSEWYRNLTLVQKIDMEWNQQVVDTSVAAKEYRWWAQDNASR